MTAAPHGARRVNGAQPPADLIAPMLATPGALPQGAGWAYEYKWDGVRAVSYVQGRTVRVMSRNDLDVTTTYPELTELADLLEGRAAVLDGEIVALDPAGQPSFPVLQQRMHVRSPGVALLAEVPVHYQVFDLLALDDTSLLDRPYQQRHELLDRLPLRGHNVHLPPIYDDGPSTLAAADAAGLEGVLAKRRTSPYRPGRRSLDWIKVPFVRTQEVVIVGYQPGAGRRAGTVGALLLAVTGNDGRLHYAGGVGTGFTDAALRQLDATLQPLRRPTPPLADVPREHARRAVWVEPTLVGEVAYRTWTPDQRLRHASWRGLRPDKSPAEVVGPGAAARPASPPPPASMLTNTGPTGAAPAGPATVTGSMYTPDGAWQIDIMQRGRSQWYRITHGENVFDWLTVDAVQQILREAGVNLADLTEHQPAED
jgi:bifunctional non-homologous end joining protein LigD